MFPQLVPEGQPVVVRLAGETVLDHAAIPAEGPLVDIERVADILDASYRAAASGTRVPVDSGHTD